MSLVHISFGGPIQTIQCGGQRVTFEMHPWCGPIALRASDHEAWYPPEGHCFWDLVTRWAQTGQRVDQHGRCIIGENTP